MKKRFQDYLIGAGVLVVVLLCWWGVTQYQAGQQTHQRSDAAFGALFSPVDLSVTQTDGVVRQATVQEVLHILVAAEVERLKQAQQSASAAGQ